MKKVEGHTHLRRTNDGSIITYDKIALMKAKAKKKKDEELQNLRLEVNELKEQINNLNHIVQELKNGR